MRQCMEVLRTGRACPCGGLWVVNGLCRGLTDGNGLTVRRWKSVSTLPVVATQGFGVGGLVRAAGCGFRGRVCGGKLSTNETTMTNG
jgi:hypothetical protein